MDDLTTLAFQQLRERLAVRQLLRRGAAPLAGGTGSLAIPVVFHTQADKTDPVANLDTDLQTIADYINAREVTIGLFAARPAAGTHGAAFYATDIGGGTLYLDSGVAWLTIASSVVVGTLANRPAFGTAGRTYFATDVSGGTLYVDTGAAWVSIPQSIVDPENKFRWLEDFQSGAAMVALGSNTTWTFDTGIVFDVSDSTVTVLGGAGGKIDVVGGGTTTQLVMASRSVTVTGGGAQTVGAFVTHTQASKNPTFFMSTAQKGATAGHTRRIGWMGTASPAANPANGIFIRYNTTAAVSFVCRSGGVETTLAAGHNSANGVYHTYRMVVKGGGTSVDCYADGVLIGTIAANIPAAALGFVAGDDTNAATDGFSLDYLAVEATR